MYSERLQGVIITPPFIPEMLNAYERQQAHLAEYPNDTETYFPLPMTVEQQLVCARRKYTESIMPHIAYIAGTAIELDKPLRPTREETSVMLDANAVGHLTEGLLRQSVDYWIMAADYKVTSIESVGAEIRALRKLNLARALWNTYISSVHEAKKLPENLAPNAKLRKAGRR